MRASPRHRPPHRTTPLTARSARFASLTAPCSCSEHYARSSFGVPTPFSHALQKLHLLHPRMLLAPAAAGAVAFETLAPLLLLAPAHLASIPFAIFGLKFHYGIALLQNIDFLSWWGPAYAFLLADPAAWAGGSASRKA